MQTRAEIQRARRAALAAEQADSAPAAAATPVVPTTAIVPEALIADAGAGARLAKLGTRVGHSGRTAGERARLASLAAMAAIVATTSISAASLAPAVIDLAELEPYTAEVPALSPDSRLSAASRSQAASRSTSRVDITDALTEYLEIPGNPDTLAAAADAISSAEMILMHERRATPEVTAEIREAVDDLREALHLINSASGDDDVAVAAELVQQFDTGWLPSVVDLDAAYDGDLPNAFEQLAEADVQAQFEELSDAHLLSLTERVESALAEAEISVPAIQPRPMTAAETLAVLAAEAKAEGAALHAAHAYAFLPFSNGRIPDAAMQNLTWQPNHQLRPDAAAQFERLNEAFHAEFGVNIAISSSYRTFAGQVAARARSGRMAATPGTSNHGWGIAVDLQGGINRFGTVQHRWMRENAPQFGWILPDWAQERGSLPEPWHWEFWGTPDPVTGEVPTPGVVRGHAGAPGGAM